MKHSALDTVVILFLPIAATIITIVFSTNIFTSILLYFGLPSLYLAFRNHSILSKSALFAALFFIPLSLFIDTIAATNGAYIIAKSIFPFKILGLSTIELYMYSFFWMFFSVLFYEHFFDKGSKNDKISHRFKYLVYTISALALLIVIIFFYNKNWLYIPYAYLVSAILFLFTPLIIFLWHHPKLTKKFAIIALYFALFMLLFELAALRNNQWFFPGQFIGFVNLYGYSFPFEELFFWIILGTPALLAYYEFFADDQK